MRKYCKDCKIKISPRAIYCSSCFLTNHNPSKNLETKEKIRIWNINNKKFVGKNNPRYKNGQCLKEYFCLDCGINIWYTSKRCKRCSNMHRFYIDGRSFENYPKEYTYYLRKKIRKRDNYKCQNCSMTEEEHLMVYCKVLNIHHIDSNKDNNLETNLITVCIRCNNIAKFNKDYWISFYKEKICHKELVGV